MEPTLRTNDILVTERLSRRLHLYDRGDIVIAKCPNQPANFICKRIIGLPGDKIKIQPRFTWNPFTSSKSIITVDVDDKGNDVPIEDVIVLIDAAADDDTDEKRKQQINTQTLSKRTFGSRMIYVPKGHVWLEGDNSENSLDSRNYGPVPMGLIQSRAIARIWPFNEATVFE